MDALAAVWRIAVVLTALIAAPLRRPAAAPQSRTPRGPSTQHHARSRAIPGARRHRARLSSLSGARKWRSGALPSSFTARRARARASMRWPMRWPRAASRALRSIFAAMAHRGRGAISAMSASSRMILPISSRWFARPAPAAPLTLLGHSAGGGFALRVAASPIQDLFARTVLLAPYLGYDAPTNRPNSGGWASADIPRIIALAVLRDIGIDCCDALPTLAFAVPPNSGKILRRPIPIG